MKNNYDLNQVSNKEINASVELTESEMNDLSGGQLGGIVECTGEGISDIPFLCPSEICNP